MPRVILLPVLLSLAVTLTARQAPTMPDGPLEYGFFTVRFAADGTFTMEGQGWPSFKGTWRGSMDALEISTPDVKECGGTGRYRATRDATHLRLTAMDDACDSRRMILDRSAWRPAGTAETRPERTIAVSPAPGGLPALPAATSDAGSWPSFRGPAAAGIAEGMDLPDTWNGPRGEHVLWKAAVPGLGHSSPVVWGDRVFVTTAVSSQGGETFRPGLYGDGDAAADRSSHRWVVMAFDRRNGTRLWERVAHEGPPVDTRHVKSTYASASPATDGRTVVAWFGSQGVYAYDVDGTPRWKVDLGHVKIGAYDIPSFEWGPASSPILWNGLVFLQADTHDDSFLLALDAATGQIRWQIDRDELPSWGTPTVVDTDGGPQLVTNGARFVRAYDPGTGRELWRIGGSSKITAPTPIAADGLIVVASGRAPERPIFVVRPTARGDITPPEGASSGGALAWSRTGRGPYMPTPLAYRGILYVLANNGVFDAYDLASGTEIYRQRLDPVGSGFSASPVAADGRIYLSSEDGEMFVIAAGREFRQLAMHSMGEPLMATPALSRGIMYVRTAKALYAISKAK